VTDLNGDYVNDCGLDENLIYKVDICVTNPEFGNWVNIDWPIYFEEIEEKNICIKTVDTEGNPVFSTWIDLYYSGQYFDTYTDVNGIGIIQIPLPTDINSCDALKNYLLQRNAHISYNNYAYWVSGIIRVEDLSDSADENCLCEYTKVIASPFNATVVLKASKSDGSPLSGKSVCVEGIDRSEFYSCKMTDNDGIAVFKLAEGEEYKATGQSITPKTFTAHDGDVVQLTEGNNPPEVYLYSMSPTPRIERPVYFEATAYDIDGDPLTVVSVKCDGQTVNQFDADTGNGYGYVSFSCTPEVGGNYPVEVEFSDGRESTTSTLYLYVIETNTPPIIYSIEFWHRDVGFLNMNELIAGTYDVYIYAYDPDGDSLTYDLFADDGEGNNACTRVEGNTFNCSFDAGSYHIRATVNDGSDESSYEVDVNVSNGYPPRITDVSIDDAVLMPGQTTQINITVRDERFPATV